MAAGIDQSEVTHFLTHRAIGDLLTHCASVGIPPEKVPTNIERVGNTVSAAILILLDEMYRDEQIESGDVLVPHTAESGTWGYAGRRFGGDLYEFLSARQGPAYTATASAIFVR